MMIRTLVAAFTLLAFSAPAVTFAADAPKATKTMSKGHKRSCYDAAWQSEEWKACEAKMAGMHQAKPTRAKTKKQ